MLSRARRLRSTLGQIFQLTRSSAQASPYISRGGLERHYGSRGGWDTPGFYSGDANNFEDLVCYWNLRAADIPLLFVDPNHLDRYGQTVASWDKTMRAMVSHRRHEFEQRVAVWVREEDLHQDETAQAMAEVLKPFGGNVSTVCPVRAGAWNGLNVCPPMMHLGQESALGVMGTESGK